MQHLDLIKWGFFLTSMFMASYHFNLYTVDINNKYINPYHRTFNVTILGYVLTIVIPSEKAVDTLVNGDYSFYIQQTLFIFQLFAILYLFLYIGSKKAAKNINLNNTCIINKDKTTIFLLFNIIILIVSLITHSVMYFI